MWCLKKVTYPVSKLTLICDVWTIIKFYLMMFFKLRVFIEIICKWTIWKKSNKYAESPISSGAIPTIFEVKGEIKHN